MSPQQADREAFQAFMAANPNATPWSAWKARAAQPVPINYGALDPQQRLDVARGVATDSARLRVATSTLNAGWAALANQGIDPETVEMLPIYQAMHADAQALIAELRAENDRLLRVIETANSFQDALEARITKLQAAPAERGAIMMPERMAIEPFTTIDKGSKNYKAGWNAYANEYGRLNPAPATAEPAGCTKPGCFPYCDCDSVDAAPATADSDAREVKP